MSLATPGNLVTRSHCIVFLCVTNHEHHNQDALLAVTKLPAALFLFRPEKKHMGLHGIFSRPESLSIGLDLVPNEMQLPQRSFRTRSMVHFCRMYLFSV
jgi:hypothetical protein